MEDNREEVGVQCNYIKLLCTIYLVTDIINVCTVIEPLMISHFFGFQSLLLHEKDTLWLN